MSFSGHSREHHRSREKEPSGVPRYQPSGARQSSSVSRSKSRSMSKLGCVHARNATSFAGSDSQTRESMDLRQDGILCHSARPWTTTEALGFFMDSLQIPGRETPDGRRPFSSRPSRPWLSYPSLLIPAVVGAQSSPRVREVVVVFKTHFDIGCTDTAMTRKPDRFCESLPQTHACSGKAVAAQPAGDSRGWRVHG